MAKGIPSKALANAILDFMVTQQYSDGSYIEVTSEKVKENITPTLKEKIDPFNDSFKINWTKLRGTLERLYHAGVISQRTGLGKRRYWKMLVKSWNKNNPFEKVGGPILDTIKPPQTDAAAGGGGTDELIDVDDLVKRIDALEATNKDLLAAFKTLTEVCSGLAKKVEEIKVVASTSVKKIVIQRPPDFKKVKITDATFPAYFDELKDLAECRENILLVGPAGCGKSTVARLLARVFKLKFGKVGGSGGVNENHLLGWLKQDLTGGEDHYQSTAFLDCYENGGVCLVDELDAMDENVLLALNSALDDTGELPLPKRRTKPLAKKHQDFVCVATANTFGRGATRVYAGRNQLDEATIDRFRMGVVEVWFDEGVEAAVCPDDDLRKWCQETREKIVKSDLRRVMSTRFMVKAYKMMHHKGWSLSKIKEKFFAGWSREEKAKVEVS